MLSNSIHRGRQKRASAIDEKRVAAAKLFFNTTMPLALPDRFLSLLIATQSSAKLKSTCSTWPKSECSSRSWSRSILASLEISV